MALTSVEREPGHFRSTTSGFRMLLLCLLAIALMVLDHSNQHLIGVRKALSVVLHPVQVVVSAPFNTLPIAIPIRGNAFPNTRSEMPENMATDMGSNNKGLTSNATGVTT